MKPIVVKLSYDGRQFSNTLLIKYETFIECEEKIRNLLVKNRPGGAYNGDTITTKYYLTDENYKFLLQEITLITQDIID